MAPRRARKKKISDDEWDAQKGDIRRMYLHDNLPLKRVRDELEKTGFSVSEDQLEYRCKRKWGFDKNISAADWKAAGQSTTLPLRSQSLQMFHNGRQLEASRVKKGVNRNRQSKQDRPKRSAGNKITTLVVPQVASGISTVPRITGAADMPNLLLGPSPSEPNQSVWHTSRHANIGAEDISLVIRLLSNGFKGILQFFPLNKYMSLNWQWLHELSRILSLGNIDVPTNKVTVHFTVAVETAVDAFGTLVEATSRCDLLTDVAEPAFEIVSSLFGLSRRINRTDLELKLLEKAFDLGHLEACRFLLDILQPERFGAKALTIWRFGTPYAFFDRLVQWRGPGRLQFLQRLMGIFPVKLVDILLRSIATHGEAGDLKECLNLLVDIRAMHPTTPHRSLLTCCMRLKVPSVAMERTRIVLEEYRRRGAVSIAQSLGTFALHPAAIMGNKDVFEYVRSFLNLKVDLSERHGVMVFHASAGCRNLEFFKHVLKQHHPPPDQAMSLYLSSFYVAFECKRFEVCNILRRQMHIISSAGVDWRAHLCSCNAEPIQHNDGHVSHQWTVGDFVFHRNDCLLCSKAWEACLDKDLELLAFCLEHGLDCRQTKKKAEPAQCHSGDAILLLEAVVHNKCSYSRDAIQLLDAVVHNICRYGETPKYGRLAQVSCAKLLLSQGLCLLGGETIAALRSGNLELAQLIMEFDKTNVGVSSAHGTSLLEAALLGGDEKCIESMWKHSGRVYDARALCAACSLLSENPSVARFNIARILNIRPSSKPVDIFETTAVGLAALKKEIDVLRGLLTAIGTLSGLCFAPLDLDENDLRPLSNIDPPTVNFYFFCSVANTPGNPQFWANNDSRCSPLAISIFSQDVAVVSALLDAGLKPDGLSISLASLSGHQGILSLLLRDPPNLRKWTLFPGVAARPPLVCAALSRDLTVLAQVLSAGADINDGGKRLRECWAIITPLQAAAAAGYAEIVALLLQKGAETNTKAGDYCGATALQYSAMYGYMDVARMLLDHGANINDPPASFDGRTCIEGAAQGGYLEMIDLLIENDVAVNGPQRVHYILAVVRAEVGGHHTIARHLQAFGGWDAADEEISKIAHLHLNRNARFSRSGREKAFEEVDWNPKDDIKNLQGRLLLQARWEAIKERQHIQGTDFGTWKSEPNAARHESSLSEAENFHSVSMATPPVMTDHISWHPSPQLSPWRPFDFLGGPESFPFIDLDFGINAAAPPGWEGLSPLLLEPGRVLGAAEDDGAEGSHGDLTFLDAPMDSLDFSWGADLS
ncbi:hypothetical protein B0T11DRAFT_130216 [Plectosphaerella cucumerina]|uniref:Clr5 domain-containing protein n=1 Tax=Plectosphaerella cucumerina TaxID=40658 RepID=A0A8K0T2Y0_9PEZI|nr:hypothetical protein B0T11DRAFT_130216 [Plectosphaerella cucumerina]